MPQKKAKAKSGRPRNASNMIMKRKSTITSKAQWSILPLEVREMILTNLLYEMLEGKHEAFSTELRRLLNLGDSFVRDLTRPLRKFAEYVASVESSHGKVADALYSWLDWACYEIWWEVTTEEMTSLEGVAHKASNIRSRYGCFRSYAEYALKRIG